MQRKIKTVFCLLFLAFFLTISNRVFAGDFTPPDYASSLDYNNFAIPIVAEISESPLFIKLSWATTTTDTSGTSYKIYRRLKSESSFTQIGTAPYLDPTFQDNNITVGTAYVYSLARCINETCSTKSYISSGIKVPLTENRGKIILLVESSIAGDIVNELAQYNLDLIGDGWQIIRHDVSSSTSVTAVKDIILADYNADPTNVKSVFIIGHIAVPYSGSVNPDGHGNRPFEADSYYGSISGTWTDTGTATGNNPGDGKFDQSYIPGQIALSVGRIDGYNLPEAYDEYDHKFTEVFYIKRYLTKDHNFRVKTTNPDNYAVISDALYSVNYISSAWRVFFGLTGKSNVDIIDPISETNLFTNLLNRHNYLWGFFSAAGDYHYMNPGMYGPNCPYYTNFPVFNLYFGSYFGNWNIYDNLLRYTIFSEGNALTASWAITPYWLPYDMGMGGIIGDSLVTSQNSSTFGQRFIFESLLGDPTLRQNQVFPVATSSFLISTNGGNINLSWTASADTNIAGYAIYRATDPDGPFTRINNSLTTGTTYTDTPPVSSEYTYMLRAVKLETTASGSFYNPSQGVFASTSVPISISITSPENGMEIFNNATATISATTSSINSISGVTFYIDSTTVLGIEDTTTPYSITLDASTHSIGTHLVSAVARDSEGNYATSSAINFNIVALPTVSATSSTDISTSSATLWGSIDDDGNASSTVRGFYYGLTTSYGSTASTTGTFGVGLFSEVLTGLTCATTYHYEAFSTNSAGTGTSSDATFTTSDCPVVTVVPVSSSGRSGGGGGSGSARISTSIITSSSTVSTASSTANILILRTILNNLNRNNTASGSIFNEDLQVGKTNQAVKALQEYLNSKGYTIAPYTTTYFGPLTKLALTKFQKDHGIPATGNLGPITRQAINSEITTTSVSTPINNTAQEQEIVVIPPPTNLIHDLKFGDTAPEVSSLQNYLNTQGYTISITGYFGPVTRSALMKYQKDHGLPATGFFGPLTRQLINS